MFLYETEAEYGDIVADFDGSLPDGAKVIYSEYEIDGYDGSAVVIFEHENKLYEVTGGHCSCYGLEGQWNPEEMSVESFLRIYKHRIQNEILTGTDSEAIVKRIKAYLNGKNDRIFVDNLIKQMNDNPKQELFYIEGAKLA